MTTLKKLDTEDDRQYWDFIKKTAQESRDQRPAWARELEEREEKDSRLFAEQPQPFRRD